MEPKVGKLCFFCAILLFFAVEHGFSQETIHVMQRGETIYSIAKSYGVSAQEVLSYNKISDPSKVQAGARIVIPGANSGTSNTGTPASSQPPARSAYNEYRVERNDTLYSLARRYGISLAELLDMNGFTHNYALKAGEKIRVPASNTGPVITSNPPVQPPIATDQARVDPSIRWPIKAKEIAYITGRLYGVQVTGDRQEGVKSLTGGTVVSAGPYRGFGRVAIVQSTNGYLYVYGGCETLSVKEGDKIVSGTELGKLGIDAKSAKSHLFFFVYRGNTPVDPAKAPRV